MNQTETVERVAHETKGGESIFELADRLRELRERKEALAEETKANNAELEDVEVRLNEAMINEGVTSFKRGDKQFVASVRTFASPKAELRERVYQWLKNHGYGDMVKETVHAQTFAAFVNELIDGEGVPEDLHALINIHEKPSVQMRKAK